MMRHLIYNYGSTYLEVLKYLDESIDRNRRSVEYSDLLKAEVRYSVREEMAQKLCDVIFRRTELGTTGHPGNENLRICADIMAQELGWSEKQIQSELEEARRVFPKSAYGCSRS
jgi:glycerol-3-phosphate dehydrogenase